MSAADDTPRRLTPTERLHEVTMATLRREPSAPESSVTIGVTAKRLHTWEVTVRGADADECDRIARRLDDGLAAKYAHEMTDGLADALEASVAAANAKAAK